MGLSLWAGDLGKGITLLSGCNISATNCWTLNLEAILNYLRSEETLATKLEKLNVKLIIDSWVGWLVGMHKLDTRQLLDSWFWWQQLSLFLVHLNSISQCQKANQFVWDIHFINCIQPGMTYQRICSNNCTNFISYIWEQNLAQSPWRYNCKEPEYILMGCFVLVVVIVFMNHSNTLKS